MARRDERVKMARPGEPEVMKTTIVGGQPPREGRSLGDVPRGVEVLIKKAAVDPPFKKLLLEKRAGAAEAIALTLSAAEAAMLEAVPEAQLRAIVANTKVSPGLRPAFLGATAAAMLAALGTVSSCSKNKNDRREFDRSFGCRVAVIEERPLAHPEEIPIGEIPADKGVITGVVKTPREHPIAGVIITLQGTDYYAIPGERGDFVFNELPPGTYDLVVGDPFTHAEIGYSDDIEVLAGERTPVWITIDDESRTSPPYLPDSIGIRPGATAEKGKFYVKENPPRR